jgi:hypothetical protein
MKVASTLEKSENFFQTFMMFFWIWAPLNFSPEDGDSTLLPTSAHGAQTQKNIIIIVTAVKTSNLLPDYTVHQPRIQSLSRSSLFTIDDSLFNDTASCTQVGRRSQMVSW